MATKIPLDDLVDQSGVTFTIELAGDVFRITLRFNDRDERYYLDLFDEDDSPIIVGVKVVLATPLLNRVVDPRRPKGDFLAVDKGLGTEPTIGTLGRSIDLVFVSWTESLAA